MNGFVYNSLRRAKVSAFRKLYLAAVAILCPNEVRRQWKRHCVKMQNELNEDHYYERGWYVYQHELCDRKWVNFAAKVEQSFPKV